MLQPKRWVSACPRDGAYVLPEIGQFIALSLAGKNSYRLACLDVALNPKAY
jgi:hypothetical protein